MATHAMMPAYKVLYYGYLSTADKELYREPLELMYTKYHIKQAARASIKVVQEELNRKGMTPQGRERKKRVCQKLWHEETTTVLRLSIYMGVLAILKEYVMIFQGSQTLVHKLHDRQLELFLAFLACFVKAKHITQLSPRALREMVLEDHILLPSKEVYVGKDADTFRSQNPNHALLVPFLADVRKAYITTAVYLQKKLPLASPTLTALSALDPLLRGHSQATIQLNLFFLPYYHGERFNGRKHYGTLTLRLLRLSQVSFPTSKRFSAKQLQISPSMTDFSISNKENRL
ncbi:uncharacterized protein LOC109615009 [Esox lucius]|uniref:uncharacterized protein LOC109615009 n=1 Tax=Esox lucius TaxID=8010 RepID=UPI0014770F8F|nr:uncharacterized protein LOC109615009 [Esox lucius]